MLIIKHREIKAPGVNASTGVDTIRSKPILARTNFRSTLIHGIYNMSMKLILRTVTALLLPLLFALASAAVSQA